MDEPAGSAAGSRFALVAVALAAAGGAGLAAELAPGPLWVALAAAGTGVAAALVPAVKRRCAAQVLPAVAPTEPAGDPVFRAVSEGGPDAVLLVADSGEIRYSNPAARDLFFEGQAPEGENFIRLAAQAPVPLREALLSADDRLFSLELEGRHETFHIARRTLGLDNELHTLVLVKHMTREISRREVQVLKKVVRLISHEANNSLAPVTSLIHSARLMAKAEDGASKLDRVFDTIEERAQHLREFLDGYATIARLPQPRPTAMDWSRLLRQLGELYPELKLPAAPERRGWFDAVQIEQLVINLMKNACESGSAVEDIELRLAVAEDGSSELEVLDRGRGFSEEALKNAMVPLYSTKQRGSGLGLALGREIVEAHGGSIGVSNRPGGGAWIRVGLPGRVTRDSPAVARSRLTLTRG